MKIREVKIRVGNSVNSRAIQEFLFENDCSWSYNCKNVIYEDKAFLYVDGDGNITFSTGEDFFTGREVDDYREMKFDFETITIVNATPRPQEKVKLFGKTYDKDELKDALTKLKPIE